MMGHLNKYARKKDDKTNYDDAFQPCHNVNIDYFQGEQAKLRP